MSVINTYGPQSLGDIIIPNQRTKKLVTQIGLGNLNTHVLLHGPSGTGKSTIALMLTDAISKRNNVKVEKNYNLVLSMKNIWAYIANELHVLNLYQGTPMYIMWFDEFDLCKHSLDIFWNALDRFNKTEVMLIATTNHLHKIALPLQSRCQVHHIPSLTVEDFLPHALDVLQQEGIHLQVQYVLGCLNIVKHFGDFRKYCDQLDQIILDHKLGDIPADAYATPPPIVTPVVITAP
jgi:replication-associated recombination protein RarA